MSSTIADSYAYCERLARREAGNFYYAFLLLPRRQRRAMCALYAFCRLSDDVADGVGSLADKRQKLAEWRQRFERALAGDFSHECHAALHDCVRTYGIPRQYLDAVLAGVALDLGDLHIATFADLHRYCYHVASAVGLACIHIWGFRDEKAKEYAESAGIAFQLTNILRDLGEDAQRGRVYLPDEDLKRFGYAPEQLSRGERTDAFHALMHFETARARAYYDQARPLLPLLTPAGQAVFLALSRTYRSLLDAIEARHFDVFSARVQLSRWRKVGFLLQAVPVRFGLGRAVLCRGGSIAQPSKL
jgi:phytoene synthase